MPEFWSLMQNIKLLGSGAGGPLPARFILNYSISHNINSKSSFAARGTRVIEAAERSYARHDKALIEEAGQWREIMHKLAT